MTEQARRLDAPSGGDSRQSLRVGTFPASSANAAFDDFARESPTPVDGIALNGLRHGKLRAKPAGYHESAANAPEPPSNQPINGTFLAHPI